MEHGPATEAASAAQSLADVETQLDDAFAKLSGVAFLLHGLAGAVGAEGGVGAALECLEREIHSAQDSLTDARASLRSSTAALHQGGAAGAEEVRPQAWFVDSENQGKGWKALIGRLRAGDEVRYFESPKSPKLSEKDKADIRAAGAMPKCICTKAGKQELDRCLLADLAETWRRRGQSWRYVVVTEDRKLAASAARALGPFVSQVNLKRDGSKRAEAPEEEGSGR